MDAPSRWFGYIDAFENRPSVVAVVHELVAVLGALQPTGLDVNRSSITSEGHGWTMRDAVVVHLANTGDEEADLHLVVGSDEAIVAWSSAHEHVFQDDRSQTRPWTSVVVDTAAAVLRGDLEIEDHYRGDKLVRTRVVNVRDEQHHRHPVAESGLLVRSWLPSRRPVHVVRRRVDWGVVHTDPAASDSA